MRKRKVFALIAAAVILCFALTSCKKAPHEFVVYNLDYSKDADYLIGVAKTAMKSSVEITAKIENKLQIGSGVIVAFDKQDDPGLMYIITNDHVIGSAAESTLTVTFAGTDETVSNSFFNPDRIKVLYRAGETSKNDLALLSIPYKSSYEDKYVPAAYSTDLDYGQHVLAVGNGLGYGTSVCDGIISSPSVDIEKGKKASEKKYDLQFIQISAPINSGNSGGGMFDMKARVVGINTLKAVSDGPDNDASVYADNLSFAIKMSDVKAFLDKYNTGKAEKDRVIMTEGTESAGGAQGL